MPRWKTQAIILHTIDYLESDRIVYALSREKGMIHGLAKGARRSLKRFPGTLEPFCEVILDVFSKPGLDLLRLEEARLINPNLGIRHDLGLYAHAEILIEMLMNHLPPLDPHPQTYAHLSCALTDCAANSSWFMHWARAMFSILSSLGYGLDMKDTNSHVQRLLTEVSGEARMFLNKGSSLDKGVLSRLMLSKRAQTEIQGFILDWCEQISEKPLRTRALLHHATAFGFRR